MQKGGTKRKIHSDKAQPKPGFEYKMVEQPQFESPVHERGIRLQNRVAVISGGDSGIGRAVAVGFAKEGANISLSYLPAEEKDARFTRDYIEKLGRKCLLFPGDVTSERQCRKIIEDTHKYFGRLDILVNNAGTHTSTDKLEKISSLQLKKTFATNVFSMFYLSKAALKFLPEGGSIINTTSVTAYRGSSHLIDYSASKGAIVSFTRSLSSSLMERKIRVNAVAPGPVWTPLIVSGLEPEEIPFFGSDGPMKRAAQPYEIASCFTFLASDDSSFISGQVIHPNGGEIINS
ncbi:MAG: SDR family oxidoreductase [Bacteroidota bacterium]